MQTKNMNVQKLIFTAMLAAVAGVLMSLEFSIPMMPPFYKIDFSDVPSLIATLIMGPAAGIAVEVVKLLIKVITVGTNSMYVGEVANLLGTVLFIIPVWIIWKKLGSTHRALLIALVTSVIIRTLWACFCNACITLPLYAKAMNVSLDDVVMLVAKVNPAITNLNSFIILATVPFNIIKLTLNYVVGHILYSRLLAARVVPASLKTE